MVESLHLTSTTILRNMHMHVYSIHYAVMVIRNLTPTPPPPKKEKCNETKSKLEPFKERVVQLVSNILQFPEIYSFYKKFIETKVVDF